MRAVVGVLMLLALASAAEPYVKITHNLDPEAKCLDGSPAALYLHEADPKNILFYLQGGGTCGSSSIAEALESCYQRSKNSYGSSLYYPQVTYAEGLLSTDPAKNIFANWTKVILMYCDGAFQQGYTKEPYSYKDSKLYFRGSLNTRAHIQYIHNRYNLTKAERVILSGSSSGGVATLAWQNYLKTLVPNSNFQLIADSGIFLRIDVKELSNIFKLSNVDEGAPSSACAAHYGKDLEWNCITFEGNFPFVKTQTFFIESAYDQFIISMRLYLPCLVQGDNGYSLANCTQQEIKVIESYREEYLNYTNTRILSAGHSIWSIDCSLHAFATNDHYYSSPNLKVPMTSGPTMQDALNAWMFEGKTVVDIDDEKWPNNKPCSQ